MMMLLALLALTAVPVSEAVPVRLRNLGPGNAVPFIVGGVATSIDNWPWQASLQLIGSHHCGAVIVRPNIVMTAAHCVNGIDWTVFLVRAGVDRLSSSAGQALSLASAPVMHWEWDELTWQGDVAILTLASAFDINFNVDIAMLIGDGESVPSGANCQITGWGRTDGRNENSQSDQLLEASVSTISITNCNQRISNPDITVDARQQCTWGSGVRTTCTGDNGGPLNCFINNDWRVAGIGSFFIGTADDSCLRNMPSVFTSISYYRAWIDEQLPPA